jgi:hypothetical protein
VATSRQGSAPGEQGYEQPAPRELKRERKALLEMREERLRDLGGLALEMYRRDRFREDLLLERCAELIGLEARVQELDTFLGRTPAPAEGQRSARCECGAPLLWGSHYCANCGRPVNAAARTSAGGDD